MWWWGRGGGRRNRGSEPPTSHTFYFRFLPLSLLIPAFLCYFYCKILCNVVAFFSIPPSSHPRELGGILPWESHFPPSRLPYPSCPLFTQAPAPLLPSTDWMHTKKNYISTDPRCLSSVSWNFSRTVL